MLSERERLECSVLTILKDSIQPMGCGFIRTALQSQGYSISDAIAVIRQDTQLSLVLEYIRKQVHSLVYVDHQKIFQNIANGHPEGAKVAMIEHIDSLIADVGKY